MKNLYLFTIFESDGGRPRCTGTLIGDKVQIYDMFRPGARKLFAVIDDNIAMLRGLVDKFTRLGGTVVTSDFKNHLRAFRLPLDLNYKVYDLALTDIKPTESLAKDSEVIRQVLTKMAKQKHRSWHKVYADASIVYQDLEERGVLNNYVLEKPVWSLKTFSGRSKAMGFPIQGFTEPHYVIPPDSGPKDLLLHFDWISADIRVAALLSGDAKLEEAFLASDPYTYMMDEINRSAMDGKRLDREECKILLLRSINSMDFTSVALSRIYTQLGDWIGRCKKITSEDGGYLETILGRRFRVAHAKNALAVLNGAQQGSVAHAMQHTIKRVWDKFGQRLIMEGHDSLVMAAPPDPGEIKAMVRAVSQIMLYPFDGLLPNNPAFPLKVSVGDKWRNWRLKWIYRPSGVEHVREAPASSDPPPQAEIGAQEPEGEGSAAEEVAAGID